MCFSFEILGRRQCCKVVYERFLFLISQLDWLSRESYNLEGALVANPNKKCCSQFLMDCFLYLRCRHDVICGDSIATVKFGSHHPALWVFDSKLCQWCIYLTWKRGSCLFQFFEQAYIHCVLFLSRRLCYKVTN